MRWGGIVLHDIINNMFAHKAIEKGADGLIAVATGAGGHAGVKNPIALIHEIREWFDGPLALSGAIATGDGVLAAQAMGADFGYIGSAFIATDEARALRRLQADDRRLDQRRHRLLEPVHRRAGQLPARLDHGRRPRPRQPAHQRREQDELRRRGRGQGVEGHLGRGPGRRRGQGRGADRRAGAGAWPTSTRPRARVSRSPEPQSFLGRPFRWPLRTRISVGVSTCGECQVPGCRRIQLPAG